MLLLVEQNFMVMLFYAIDCAIWGILIGETSYAIAAKKCFWLLEKRVAKEGFLKAIFIVQDAFY